MASRAVNLHQLMPKDQVRSDRRRRAAPLPLVERSSGLRRPLIIVTANQPRWVSEGQIRCRTISTMFFPHFEKPGSTSGVEGPTRGSWPVTGMTRDKRVMSKPQHKVPTAWGQAARATSTGSHCRMLPGNSLIREFPILLYIIIHACHDGDGRYKDDGCIATLNPGYRGHRLCLQPPVLCTLTWPPLSAAEQAKLLKTPKSARDESQQ